MPTSADAAELGEFELIRRFFAAANCARPTAGVVLGIGDDAALLQLPAQHQMVISTDSLVEGVHFPQTADPFLLGQRALAVAASDLAAMGANPLAFTLALTLPQVQPEWLSGFARGLDLMAQYCGLSLIGGDTARGPLSITPTVFGSVPEGAALRRSGAKVGDLVCVSGSLGAAAAALPLVLQHSRVAADLAAPCIAQYWSPKPQLALGQALRLYATAAIDISDGLLADCTHLANSSAVAVRIDLAKIPVFPVLEKFLSQAQALECALTGGDDYQLLFTLAPQDFFTLQTNWPNIVVIGEVVVGDGVQLYDARGLLVSPAYRGFEHFRSVNDR